MRRWESPISKRFGYATVVNVLPGSPADQEHLRDGDVIDLIDGQSTHDLPLAVIRFMLDGKPGTTVTISVVRPFKPDPDKITLTRTMVAAPPLGEQFYENATILYLKPGILTAARVDDIAARIKGGRQGAQDPARPARHHRRRPQAGIAAGQLLHQAGTLASLEGQKFPRRSSPPIPRNSSPTRR